MSAEVTEIVKFNVKTIESLAFFACKVAAGFPSPAEDWIENQLDLNELLVTRPASTFLLRVAGDSMKDVGIYDGSILVVDKSITAATGRIVIATVDGEFLVKTLVRVSSGQRALRAANKDYPDILINEDAVIWGVVTSVIQKF